MKQKLLAVTLALVSTVGMLSGCGSSSSGSQGTSTDTSAAVSSTQNPAAQSSTEGQSADTTSGNSDGEKSVTIPFITTVSTLDETASSIDVDMSAIRAFSAGLYKDTPDGYQLDLTSDEKLSDDKLTRTYTIRDDAKWSDGQPIRAQDFVYAWQRLADPNSGAEYAFFLQTLHVKNAAEVESGKLPVDQLGVSAPDDHTFVVETDGYTPYFEEIANFVQFKPLRQDVVEASGDQYGLSTDSIVASGVWKPVEWTPGSDTITYERNDQYWDQSTTNLDKLTFQTINDAQTQVMSYESGQIDYLPLSGDLVAQYQDNPDLKTVLHKQLHYIEPNLSNQYLSNNNIRKALAYAINRQAVCDDILKNGSIPAQFIVVENLGEDSEGKTFRERVNKTYYEYDEEKAQEYWQKGLSELGTDNVSLEILYDDTPSQGDIAQYLQATLQQILPGLTITTQQQPKKNRLQLMISGDYDLGLTKWGADYNDPSTFTDLFRTGASYNHSGYSNPEYDALLDKASNEDLLDVDKRYDDYDQAEQILMDDLPGIPLYQDGDAYLVKPDVTIPVGVSGLFGYEFSTRQ